MKKLLFLFCLIGANMSLIGVTYDFNTKVIQNDNFVGGNFVVEVQVRSTVGTMRLGGVNELTNQPGGFLVHLQMNSSALTFSSGALNSIFNPFALKVTNYTALNGVRMMARTRNDGVFVDIPTTWTTLATITYTIVSLTPALNFEFKPNAVTLTDYTSANLITHTQGDISNSVVNNNGVWSGGNGAAGSLSADGFDLGKTLSIINSASPVVLVGPGNYRVDKFTIETTGKLEVGPTAALEPWSRVASDYIMDGTVKILADASGYGQYKGPSIPLTFSQYWNTDLGWRDMGFPVTSASNLDFGGSLIRLNGGTSAICTPSGNGAWGNYVNTTNIYEFTAGLATPCNVVKEHEYVGLTASPSGGTQGYQVFIGGTSSFATNGIISIEGSSMTSGSFNYTQSAPHAAGTGSRAGMDLATIQNWDGWRLLSNPFTCNLDVAQWASDNGIGAASVRIWDRTQNGGSGAYVNAPSIIAPGQGFWLKYTSNQVLNFDLYAHGIIGSAAVTKNKESVVNLYLNAEKGSFTKAVIAFNENATNGYDNLYDGFYKGPNHEVEELTLAFQSEILTNELNEKGLLSFNTVGNDLSEKTLELYIDNQKAQELSFSINQSEIPQGMTISIEDKALAPGVLHDLVNSKYSFYSVPASNYNRFVVHINGSGNAGLANESNTLVGLSAWFAGNELVLGNIDMDLVKQIQVYNMAGQMVAENLSGTTISIGKLGVYIVSVQDIYGNLQQIRVVKF